MADPVAWKVVERGWTVAASDGNEVGKVDQVIGDPEADIFDGLAAATAGLATALPVWLSLLIMFGGLLVLAMILGGAGAALLKKGAKPVPEQAIEEARLTTEAIRNGH